MAAAYVSPPRSPTEANTPPKAMFAVLNQPPPPSLREILSAYSTKGEGDRELLISLLKAKAAEDTRIATVAQLQQQVIQMQMTALNAHVQSLNKRPPPAEAQRQSPVSPSPPTRRRSHTPVRSRAHPYIRPSTEEHPLWRGRKSWGVGVSDERSTSEERVDY